MKKIEVISKWLKEKNTDVAFITSKENVLYLTGFDCHPHERLLAAVVFQNADPLLIVPKLDQEDAKRSGWAYNIVGITDTDDAWQMVQQVLEQRVANIQSIAIEKEHLIYERFTALNRVFKNPTFVPVEEAIQASRMQKSESELATMREAARLADYAIEIGMREIAEGRSELEVLAALEFELKKQGVSKMAFDTILLTGANAASPHGVSGNTKIKKGDFVLFDLGILVDGYCSDITRTVAFGEVSAKQQEIYQTVLKAQLAAVAAVAPGKTCSEIDLTARNIIAEAGYGDYFPHRLGHGLGISVHEAPNVTSVSQTVLKPGMVFTIEPGIYVPNVAGVRIEDDVVVTENGVETLTKFPKELLYV